MSGPYMVPDGSPASAAGNAAAAQLVVHGVGIEADLAELAAIADRLAASADDLDGALATGRAAFASLTSTSPYDAVTGAAALGRCDEANALVSAAAESARDLERDVRRVAADYADAEAQAGARFVHTVPRPRVLPVEPPAWDRIPRLLRLTLLSGFARGQWTPTDAQTGHFLEELAWTVTGGPLYPSWAPFGDDPLMRVAHVAAPLVTFFAGVTTSTRVRRIDPPGVIPDGDPRRPSGPALGRVEDLVAGVHALHPMHGGTEGTIRVDRVVSPDGTRSWQVLIPGTQTDWWPGMRRLMSPAGPLAIVTNAIRNRNPFDWGTNLQAYTGHPTAVEAGVTAALTRAGARPGEPVLLVGHSQGAMTAMRLAEDEQVRERFSITSVVTVGGPVGHIPTPEGVAVLSLEHVDDLTPGVDGRPNPVEYGRTTVIRDLAASPDPADAGVASVVQAHDTPAYSRTARMVDASREDAVLAWFAASEGALPDTAATATSQYFQIERS